MNTNLNWHLDVTLKGLIEIEADKCKAAEYRNHKADALRFLIENPKAVSSSMILNHSRWGQLFQKRYMEKTQDASYLTLEEFVQLINEDYIKIRYGF